MPICITVTSLRIQPSTMFLRTCVRRVDPVLFAVTFVVVAIVGWSCLPLATGAGPAPVNSGARVDLEVPITTSVTPGWQSGDTSVRLDDLVVPGKTTDASSTGWRLTTNWPNGYEVRVRSTSDPALRGSNSVDGAAARDSFADFSTAAACPCPWSTDSAKKGVFGYSVSVSTANGAAAKDGARWGTNQGRKWRGFSRGSYRAFSTPGGAGTYLMTLHLRSEIPDGMAQVEGSYRASVVVSTHPML